MPIAHSVAMLTMSAVRSASSSTASSQIFTAALAANQHIFAMTACTSLSVHDNSETNAGMFVLFIGITAACCGVHGASSSPRL